MASVQQLEQHAAQRSSARTLSTATSMTTSTVATTNSYLSTTSSTTRSRQNSAAQQHPQQPILVRALYDYHSSDPTNLSFQAGTLIRVLTQLESGWWDGCIDSERGWFPCNFVIEVDESQFEGEEELIEDSYSSSEDEGERALDEDLLDQEFAWIPQTDNEGRTFFLNTVNGTTSWELPATKVFLDDWEDKGRSDDDRTQRSSIDSDNSEIIMLPPMHPSTYIEKSDVRNIKHLPAVVSVPQPPASPTYESLLQPLRTSVERLCASAATYARNAFPAETDAIITAVSCISSSVPHDHKDPQIQRFLYYNRYRPMVAALCSLITSTKVASGDWSPDAQIHKMESDAHEVVARAEAFLEYALQVAGVVSYWDKPYFMPSKDGRAAVGGSWTSNSSATNVRDTTHLEVLWMVLEKEKENVERCVKAMGLPSQRTNRRKNSLVIVDENLTIPFMLISVKVTIFQLID